VKITKPKASRKLKLTEVDVGCQDMCASTSATSEALVKETKIQLGPGMSGRIRYLTAGEFDGEIKIHIREYDDRFPTKNGVTFSGVRWASLLYHMDNINEAVQKLNVNEAVDYKQHIGKGLYVCVKSDYKCVNFRKFFLAPDGLEHPSSFGIALRLPEWETLKERAREIGETYPEISALTPCYQQFTHSNIITYLECRECNPFAASDAFNALLTTMD
jgi:Transcriptional Coactivator p15 (PC4)